MKSTIAAATLALVTSSAGALHAEQVQLGATAPNGERRGYFSEYVAAPSDAFELSMGMGYTQPFGSLQSGAPMSDVAGTGASFDLGGAYRINPRWAVGLTGEFQELNAERATGARGMTWTVAGAYHIAPYRSADPWVQLGTGYRAFWETQNFGHTVTSHAIELGKLTAGIDFHLIDGSVVAPVIGADLNLFLWQDNGVFGAINNPTVSGFVFAGIQGRIDFGGMRTESGATSTTAMR
jgi:hypothetical protein